MNNLTVLALTFLAWGPSGEACSWMAHEHAAWVSGWWYFWQVPFWGLCFVVGLQAARVLIDYQARRDEEWDE